MLYTLIDHTNGVKMSNVHVLVQRFQHFEVISTVDNSTDHGKLCTICCCCCLLTSLSGEVSWKNCAIIRSFLWSMLSSTIALDHSACGKRSIVRPPFARLPQYFVCPSKLCITLDLLFSLGITVDPREIKDNA